ncbi:MAG TPA: redoxin domain-containing protein [Gemmatimonadaceae bacterium]|nr:redoxin domain-containing protein [Gemmatimonadaceae bacterium]
MKAPRVALAVFTVIAGAARSAQSQTPTPAALPSVASIKTSGAAASVLRDLYFKQEYYDGIALGDTLTKRFPRDSRLRAWHVAHVAVVGYSTRADSMTAKIDTASRDPWLLAARSFARHNPPAASRSTNAEAVRLARRAQKLAPRENDFIWLVATDMFSIPGFPSGGGAPVVAYIDSVSTPASRSIEVEVIRANALYSAQPFNPSRSTPPDTAGQNAALRAYAAVRSRDSTHFMGYYDGAARLRSKDDVQALALAKRAVEIAPRSPNARRTYWALLDGQRGPVAPKRAAIVADRAAFLAVTDSAPWALDVASSSMRYTTKESAVAIDDRILARFPRSAWAENVMLNRVNEWRDSLSATRDSTTLGPKSDSVLARRRYIDGLEAFINKPWTADPNTRDRAVLSLFFEVRADTTYPASKLIPLAHQIVDAKSYAPTFRYGEAARALSNRKLELPFAQQLAREGLKHTASYVNDFPGYVFTSVGDQANTLDRANASMYDHLGWTLYVSGRPADAEKEIKHALELTKKDVNIYFDLGRVQAAQGREDEAELTYAQGMTVGTRGVNPNRAELARLYEKKNGSVDGWEKYVKALEEKERATRRAKILATRDTTPKAVPGFTLPDLEGRVVKSDSLRSQTVIVNFWGTWCGPCVAEMPELQQFYEKYKNDKSVAIFTIANDKDVAELREWMAKRNLTIPTLFDDGYVEKTAQMHVFPTTWFIDNTGKIQFRAVGNTGALVDEWTWRLEATKTGPVVQP